MPPSVQNVIVLHPERRPAEDLPVPLERLGTAVRQLDRFGRCVEQIVGGPYGSEAECRVMFMPLMLRLPEVRRSLAELARIRADRWQDTHSAVRFRAVCDEVERRLLDVSMAMSSLIYREPGGIDTAVSVGFDGARLAEAVDELRQLIASQYPGAVGGS